MTVSNDTFMKEVREGLSLRQKTLNPKWLYDRKGSELFEDITGVEDYYPTRTEAKIFARIFPTLKGDLGPIDTIIEYGSGSSRKTGPLLAALRPATYVPIDISAEFLKAAAADLADDHPDVRIVPVAADFNRPVPLPDGIAPPERRLGFFPGSTIGNFAPGTAVPFLEAMRETLGSGSRVLISGDLIKAVTTLEAAYDDSQGVTAAFNLNLLTRINRELGADFDPDGFRHRAVWNPDHDRIEMHLVSLRDQVVTIGGEEFRFGEGETIHTESSHKYTIDSMRDMAAKAGFDLVRHWTDEDDLFGVFLLRA